MLWTREWEKRGKKIVKILIKYRTKAMNTFLPKRHHRRRRRRRSSLEGGGGTRLFRYLVVFVFAFAQTTISIRADDATIFGGRKLFGGASFASNGADANLRTTRYLHRLPSTFNEKLFNLAWGYVVDLLSSRRRKSRLNEWKLKRNINAAKTTWRATSPHLTNSQTLSTESFARIEHGVDDFSISI